MDAVSPRAKLKDDGLRIGAKQLLFVQEYMKDHNGTQAAIRAGYSRNGAATAAIRLLRTDVVARVIAQKERELAQAADIDNEWVMKHLKDNVFRCIDLEDVSALNRTLELIGKQIGMFVDRSNINIAIEQIERVERRIVHPPKIIDDVDYSVDDKRRKD